MRVLVVEDEAMMAEAIAAGLGQEAIAVDVVDNGADEPERARVNAYDLLVLDRDIPVVHGDAVCRALVDGGCGVPHCHVRPAVTRVTSVGGWVRLVGGDVKVTQADPGSHC